MKAVSYWQGYVKEEQVKDIACTIEENSKQKLLDFLNSAPILAAAAGTVYDEIAHTQTDIPLLAYEKDGFGWDSRDIYYLEKYNVRLNDDFVAHVLAET